MLVKNLELLIFILQFPNILFEQMNLVFIGVDECIVRRRELTVAALPSATALLPVRDPKFLILADPVSQPLPLILTSFQHFPFPIFIEFSVQCRHLLHLLLHFSAQLFELLVLLLHELQTLPRYLIVVLDQLHGPLTLILGAPLVL